MNRGAKLAIKADLCTPSCTLCIDSCPVDVLEKSINGAVNVAYPDDCQGCFLCEEDCPNEAIHVTSPASLEDLVNITYLNASDKR